MPVHRGMSTSLSLSPEVTTSAVQEFNQDRASFVCYVSANDYLTTVSFQYNTTNNWSSYTTVSAGTTLGQNQMMYANVVGLSVGTTYYVRAVVQSSIGSAIGGVVSFTTWSLKTYIRTTAGSYSVSVPSITPIGSPTLNPIIYEMLIYGGGGAAGYGGGGGGGYRIASSYVSPTAGTQNVTGTIGAGGTNPSNVLPAPAGGASTINIGGTVFTAGGGTGGDWLTNPAGTAGSGNNPQYGGGVGYYGYTYISGYNTYCCETDKYGNCTATCPDYNSPIYTTDYNRYAGGGGGGTDGGGANAGYPDVGGNGGPGGGAYGLRGGNGGGGGGTAAWGSAGSVPAISGPVVGTGGTGWWQSGVAGGVTFKYYGP